MALGDWVIARAFLLTTFVRNYVHSVYTYVVKYFQHITSKGDYYQQTLNILDKDDILVVLFRIELGLSLIHI